MPEEVLKYRIEIDQADLASQLTGIKNQIDSAIGSFAYTQAAQAPVMDPIVGQISSFSDQAMLSAAKFQESIIGSRNLLYGGFDTGRIGYQKFTSDLEMAGLITPPGYIEPSRSLYAATRDYAPPQLQDYGAFRSGFAGAFGFGHDPNDPISRGEYKRVMQESFGTQIVDAGITLGSIGTALLAATPIGAPAAIAGTAAFILNEVAKAGAFEHEGIKNFGTFIERSSFRNMQALSRTESRDAARYIRNLSEDVDFRVAFGDPTDIENIIGGAVGAGIFLDTGNLEQFKTRAKETLENFRVIQHTLNATTEEAMQIMGEMTRGGLASTPGAVASFVSQARSFGDAAGYTGREMLQIGAQAAEIVRGTGINMSGAGITGMRFAAMMREGVETGSIDRELLLQAGGTDQAGLVALRTAADFSNMPAGRLMTLARMGGGGLETSIGGLYGAAMRGIEDFSPQGMLNTFTAMRENRNATDVGLFALDKARADFMAMKAGGINDITQAGYQTFLIQQGLGETAAGVQAAVAFTNPNFYMNSYLKESQDLMNRVSDEQPDPWQRIWAGITITGRQAYQATAGGFFNRFRAGVDARGEDIASFLFPDFMTSSQRQDAKIVGDIAASYDYEGPHISALLGGKYNSILARLGKLDDSERKKATSDILDIEQEKVDALVRATLDPKVRPSTGLLDVFQNALQIGMAAPIYLGIDDEVQESLDKGFGFGNLLRTSLEKVQKARKGFANMGGEVADEYVRTMDIIMGSDAASMLENVAPAMAQFSQGKFYVQGFNLLKENLDLAGKLVQGDKKALTAIGMQFVALGEDADKKDIKRIFENANRKLEVYTVAESLVGKINMGSVVTEAEKDPADTKLREEALKTFKEGEGYFADKTLRVTESMEAHLRIIAHKVAGESGPTLTFNGGLG